MPPLSKREEDILTYVRAHGKVPNVRYALMVLNSLKQKGYIQVDLFTGKVAVYGK